MPNCLKNPGLLYPMEATTLTGGSETDLSGHVMSASAVNAFRCGRAAAGAVLGGLRFSLCSQSFLSILSECLAVNA